MNAGCATTARWLSRPGGSRYMAGLTADPDAGDHVVPAVEHLDPRHPRGHRHRDRVRHLLAN